MTRTEVAVPLLLLVCCKSPAPPEPEGWPTEPTPTREAAAAEKPTAMEPPAASSVASVARSQVPAGHRRVDAKPVASVQTSPDDPLAGKFGVKQAFEGLDGSGSPIAEIRTSLGTLKCDLYEDKAPITVANFVGLARGLRPFKTPKGDWVKRPAYNGTTFHRVIRGFMIQGGDPEGTGAGEPGYLIPDEIWNDAYHSERGLLCMANRGPNTNGMQFFIMDGSAPHLDNGYTIFGKCGPTQVIDKLASVEVQGDRAVNPPKIEAITIQRGTAAKAKDPPATGG